ncbi:UNVERIFIED_CONTAM: hypothetical protein GTU68_025670, partial [Idotea baltica]|nr:hypothetical protein [Idotea baltica]
KKVLLIGASTGGAKAIENIILNLPNNFIPTVITQHMPPGFTKSFASRVNQINDLVVKEAEHNEILQKNHVYIAPGGTHCLLINDGGSIKINLKDGPPVMQHKPSVDVLFKSGVKALKDNTVGVLLTGMGSDGANGLKDLYDCGAYTIAQDESTSVVFGMPKVAIELGAAKSVEKLENIPAKLISILEK